MPWTCENTRLVQTLESGIITPFAKPRRESTQGAIYAGDGTLIGRDDAMIKTRPGGGNG
jgi:hypothetical protein